MDRLVLANVFGGIDCWDCSVAVVAAVFATVVAVMMEVAVDVVVAVVFLLTRWRD